jgi:hypothetical protein
MKNTLIWLLGLVMLLSAGAAIAEDTTTTTTTTTSTTINPLSPALPTAETKTTGWSVTTTPLASSAATALPPVSTGGSIRSGAKNIILDNINLIMDSASNYKRDRFILSRDYLTYIKLIKDNKGKESAASKSLWADIQTMEKTTLPESELQVDKLLKDLRNYVQDLN